MKIVHEEITPVCPFCEEKLEKLVKVDRGWFEVNRVFCCPHCHKIVGLSSNA